MIRAVFFDLDGTLYDRDAAILRMAEEQFEAFREELDVDKPVFMERLVALDGHGHDRTPRLHHALADMLGLGADLADRLETFFRSRYPPLSDFSGQSEHTRNSPGKRQKAWHYHQRSDTMAEPQD